MKHLHCPCRTTRRSFLSGLGCVLCIPGQFPVALASSTEYLGCNLAPSELVQFGLSNGPPPDQEESSPTLYKQSGDANFDQSLGTVLVMMSEDFEVSPGFFYYEDRTQSNAKATAEPKVDGTSGTVMFGTSLLKRLLSKQDGDGAIAAVCAHEFGHIYQFQSEYHQNISQRLPVYCMELHADYMAGWFLAKLKARRPAIQLFEAGRFIESIGNTKFDSPDFHGTPNQRKKSIESGYNFSQGEIDADVGKAANKGLDYLVDLYG